MPLLLRAAARLGRYALSAPATRFFATNVNREPISHLQALSHRVPERLSRLLAAAKSVVDDSVFLTSDTETTGISHDKYGPQRVLELGLVASRGGIVESANHFLINPERPIQMGAFKVHGIKQSPALPTFKVIAPHFMKLLAAYPEATLWFHNAPFDRRMLTAEFARTTPELHKRFEATNTCCSLSLAKLLRPNTNKLDDLLTRYGIDAQSRENGHGALIDSRLLAAVLPQLADEVLTTAEKAKVLDNMLALNASVTHTPPSSP